MQKTLDKFIVWPGYYAFLITLFGLLLSGISWFIASLTPVYQEYMRHIDISWFGIASIGGVLISVFSLSVYEYFNGRRKAKLEEFINNEKMMWQLLSFIITASMLSGLMIIFKTQISEHIINGLNIAYTAFIVYFVVLFLKMLFTNK